MKGEKEVSVFMPEMEFWFWNLLTYRKWELIYPSHVRHEPGSILILSIGVSWVSKWLVLPPPSHPCQLRSGSPCLVSITVAMHSTEYRIFVCSVHHCVPGIENPCWVVTYAVCLASFYHSPPITTDSFPTWGHPPAENPSHARQIPSS